MVYLTDDSAMLYQAEQNRFRRFPRCGQCIDLRGGPRRNFQVFSALEFVADDTQHIPDKGEHLVRYYGGNSHRQCCL